MSNSEPVIRATSPLERVDMVPHAIFGRPIQYFTLDYYEGHDDLDVFKYAAFALNNECHFCLRHYRGHPRQTVTVYLEYDFGGAPDEVRSILEAIVDGFRIPTTAVRWKRGDPIDYGSLKPLKGRLREPEARILTLKIALTQPHGRASTSYIKEHIPLFVPLTREDLEPSPTRGNEQKWQQVAGNVISHQYQSTSIFALGYAVRTGDGIRVTGSGKSFLTDIGFSARQLTNEDRYAMSRKDPEFDFD
jgi:hypothetical protein